MEFGLVVTDDRHGDAAVALLADAQARGWQCRCFLTDRGALLLSSDAFTASPAVAATQVAVCELSIERYEDEGLQTGAISSAVKIGGQYQDADLVRHCDRVLVL